MTPEEFKDLAPGYVAAGAAWLDENEPGWEGRIDLAELDLFIGCRCVLGQVCKEGSYIDALLRVCCLRWSDWARGGSHQVSAAVEWAVSHGFNVPVLLQNERSMYEVLDELWIILIKERYDSGLLSG